MKRSTSKLRPKELIKRGRRTLGAIYETSSGKPIYLHLRRHGDLYRAGEPTMSDAVRKGVASWSIDEETLIKLRARGIEFVGILDRDTGDRYLTTLEAFMTKGVRLYGNAWLSNQRFLNLSEFRVRMGAARQR